MRPKLVRIAQILAVAVAAQFGAGATCSTPQAAASATYIAAETGTGALITKHPELVPAITTVATTLQSWAGGTLTLGQASQALAQIITETKAAGVNVPGFNAYLFDAAMTQLQANVNTTAPTPISGAAKNYVLDVANGVQAALTLNGNMAPSVGK